MTALRIRTAVSAGPPGGNGTMSLIGLDGKACANAMRGSDSAANTAAEWTSRERRVVISIPHSITSSAVNKSFDGISISSAFAVFWLMTVSNFADLHDRQVARLLALENAADRQRRIAPSRSGCPCRSSSARRPPRIRDCRTSWAPHGARPEPRACACREKKNGSVLTSKRRAGLDRERKPRRSRHRCWRPTKLTARCPSFRAVASTISSTGLALGLAGLTSTANRGLRQCLVQQPEPFRGDLGIQRW